MRTLSEHLQFAVAEMEQRAADNGTITREGWTIMLVAIPDAERKKKQHCMVVCNVDMEDAPRFVAEMVLPAVMSPGKVVVNDTNPTKQ